MIKPIGKIVLEEQVVKVQLEKRLIRALKYLDKFSHLLVIYEDTERLVPFCEKATEIIQVNEKQGWIELHLADERDKWQNDQAVYDIKPYFPCEDCVRVSYEGSQKNQKDYLIARTDLDHEGNENEEIDIDSEAKEVRIRPIGEIRQLGGSFYLILKEGTQVDWEMAKSYSHLKVFWWFHRFDKPQYRQIVEGNPPYENAPRTGIFATRSPVRPNPIALTTVPILKVEKSLGRIKVGKMDCFDRTPLIEVLPYKAKWDRIEGCKQPSWLSHWPMYLEETEEKEDFVESQEANPTNHHTTMGAHKINEAAYDEEDILGASFKEEQLFQKYFSTDEDTNLTLEQHMPDQHISAQTYKKVDNWLQGEERASHQGIHIVGAKQNNLKGIEVTIPYEKLTVITGVSGSGKSSLAFDTLYAESQRRMMGNFGGMGMGEVLEKPEVEAIYGLLPAVAISQKHIRCQPRSTVGTLTGIADDLRKLFAYVGTRHCPKCQRVIRQMTEDEIIDGLLRIKPDVPFSIRPFNEQDTNETLSMENHKQEKVDCIKMDYLGEGDQKALKERVYKALQAGKGALRVQIEEETFTLQTTQKCYHCDHILFELTPSSFSFNNPESMCLVCKGMGSIYEVDEEKIVENEELSILDGASSFWGNLRKFREKPNANWMKGEVLGLAQKLKVDLEKPWKDLPEAFKKAAIWGTQDEEVTFAYENNTGRKGEITRPVEGAYHIIERLHAMGNTAPTIEENYMKKAICPSCQGERLNEEGRYVTLGKWRYPQIGKMSIIELVGWVDEVRKALTRAQCQLVNPLLEHIKVQALRLNEVGVGYLSLDRGAQTLSGGELQRIRFTTLFENGMTHMLYVLDEPTAGLHKRDKVKLISLIKDLTKAHHTIVAVEHDRQMMQAADCIIDIGPGAGSKGGELVAWGTPHKIQENYSITGPYLNETSLLPTLSKKELNERAWLKVVGAHEHNLKQVEVQIPLGCITCITGVSGSGKSSLVSGVIYPEISHYLKYGKLQRVFCKDIEGIENVQEIVQVSQSPIGRNSRSNPATYTGIMDEVRTLFSKTSMAKERGYKQAHFSFNSKEGQCSHCHGEGRMNIEAAGMPDLWNTCPVCKGKRYKKEVLEVKYQGKDIASILDMSIRTAKAFFSGIQQLEKRLEVLEEVGLGYLKLGQSATTLSGGEAQRLKLATNLCSDLVEQRETDAVNKKCLYLLDEPSTGLHFQDIEKLMLLLRKMTSLGHSIVMIEHHEDMIQNSDWMIELGPEGGSQGGYVLSASSRDNRMSKMNQSSSRDEQVGMSK